MSYFTRGAMLVLLGPFLRGKVGVVKAGYSNWTTGRNLKVVLLVCLGFLLSPGAECLGGELAIVESDGYRNQGSFFAFPEV